MINSKDIYSISIYLLDCDGYDGCDGFLNFIEQFG